MIGALNDCGIPVLNCMPPKKEDWHEHRDFRCEPYKPIPHLHEEDLIPVMLRDDKRLVRIDELVHFINHLQDFPFPGLLDDIHLALRLSKSSHAMSERTREKVAALDVNVKDNNDSIIELQGKTFQLRADLNKFNDKLKTKTVQINFSEQTDNLVYDILQGDESIGRIKIPKKVAKTLTFKGGKFSETEYNPDKNNITVNIPLTSKDIDIDIKDIDVSSLRLLKGGSRIQRIEEGELVDYNDLIYNGKSDVVLSIPSKVSDLENDSQYIPESQKGAANGVASLNESSLIPEKQLPGSVKNLVQGYYIIDGYTSDGSKANAGFFTSVSNKNMTINEEKAKELAATYDGVYTENNGTYKVYWNQLNLTKDKLYIDVPTGRTYVYGTWEGYDQFHQVSDYVLTLTNTADVATLNGILLSQSLVENKINYNLLLYSKDTISTASIPKLLIEVTYNELVKLRDESKLIPGQQYRITDYECIVDTDYLFDSEENDDDNDDLEWPKMELRSAGHKFDIIVTADSVNTLNAEARAINHEGETYFKHESASVGNTNYSIYDCYIDDGELKQIYHDTDDKVILYSYQTFDTKEEMKSYLDSIDEDKDDDYYSEKIENAVAYNGKYYISKGFNNGMLLVNLTKLKQYFGTDSLETAFNEKNNYYWVFTGTKELDGTTYYIWSDGYADYAAENSIEDLPKLGKVELSLGYDCKLYAWKLWYSLDNSFSWATKDSKGVIYRMIDEFGNDCPYDFKNIQYLAHFTKDNPLRVASNGDYDYGTMITTDKLLYTFSNIIDLDDEDDPTQSVHLLSDGSVEDNYSVCTNNIIESLSTEYTLGIPQIILVQTYYSVFVNNTFNGGCNKITLGGYIVNNIFKGSCLRIWAAQCSENTFGTNCTNIRSEYIEGNTFGKQCDYIVSDITKSSSICNNIFLPTVSNIHLDNGADINYSIIKTGNFVINNNNDVYRETVSLNSENLVVKYNEADLIKTEKESAVIEGQDEITEPGEYVYKLSSITVGNYYKYNVIGASDSWIDYQWSDWSVVDTIIDSSNYEWRDHNFDKYRFTVKQLPDTDLTLTLKNTSYSPYTNVENKVVTIKAKTE